MFVIALVTVRVEILVVEKLAVVPVTVVKDKFVTEILQALI